MQCEAAETRWPEGARAGGAWLSSARVVRCWVKSATSATPVHVASIELGTRRETAGVKPEEGGDDVKSSMPLMPWAAYYNGQYRGCHPRADRKAGPQFGSQAATRLREVRLLLIADQHAAVNTFPALYTARHTTESSAPEAAGRTLLGRRRRRCGEPGGEVMFQVAVPRRVRLDHLPFGDLEPPLPIPASGCEGSGRPTLTVA